MPSRTVARGYWQWNSRKRPYLNLNDCLFPIRDTHGKLGAARRYSTCPAFGSRSCFNARFSLRAMGGGGGLRTTAICPAPMQTTRRRQQNTQSLEFSVQALVPFVNGSTRVQAEQRGSGRTKRYHASKDPRQAC